MDYRGIQKLKAFFSALKTSGFKQDLKQIPSFALVDGQRTPVDKAYCLSLLRSLPQFQGDKFKDDNAIIKYLSDPINRKFLLGNFTQQQQIELTKVLEEKPVVAEAAGEQPTGQEQPVPAGQTVGESPASMTGGGIPQIPTIHNVPRVYRPPKPPEVKTYPKPPVIETGLDYEGKPYESDAAYKTPKEKVLEKTAPPARKTTEERPRFKFQNLRMPAGIKEFGKTVASKAGIFINRNIIGITRTGLGVFAGGALTGWNPLAMGMGGIGGFSFPAWGKKVLNGSINAGVRLSNQVSRGGLNLAGPKKKIVLLFLGMFGGFFLLTAFTGAGTPGGGTTPGGTSTTGLDYTLPLKDPTITPLDIRNDIKAVFSGAKLEYWDNIIQRARNAGLNPAVALALWIEETGASHTTLIRNGGSEIPVNGRLSKGHLGCAPGEDQTIDESLTCLINFVNRNNFTNDQFAEFMARYSGGPANAPFSNNPDFTTNFKLWYSRLVPSGTGAITAVTTGAVASCPVVGGTISTPSYQADPQRGHCNDNYRKLYTCNCGTSGRRAKAIDVTTNGKEVKLPKINGQDVTWKLITKNYLISGGEGGGVGNTFEAIMGTDRWYLDILHLTQTSLAQGSEYPSGTTIGTSVIQHAHMTIGKNLSRAPTAGTDTDCDQGWLPSDFMCQ